MFPTLTYVDTMEDAVADADALLVLTEWAEFVDADPSTLAGLVNTPVVIDARNCLDADAWRSAGWNFRALGRPVPVAAPAVPVTTGPVRTLVSAR
jgi:UDPglucose 6-dehydrogenase